MYARYMEAHHGSGAANLARKKADALRAEGDHQGHQIWLAVADAVDRHPNWPKPKSLKPTRRAA
jgi:hypothetical protein